MATRSVTRSERYLATTSMMAAKSARDADYESTPVLMDHDRLLGKGKPSRSGGDQWVYDIEVGDHSTSTRVQTGYEQMSMTGSAIHRPIIFQPAAVQHPVVISQWERDINSGEGATIKLGEERSAKVMRRAKREWDRQAVKGGVPAHDDFNTWNGVDHTTTGFFVNQPRGSQSQTIGGFNRGTWASSPGVQHQHYDMAGSANAAALPALWNMTVAAKNRTEDQRKLAIYVSEVFMVFYKQILQPQERYVGVGGNGKIDAGSLELYYEGLKLCSHMQMPNDGTNTTADPISVYIVDYSAVRFEWLKSPGGRDGYFQFFPFAPVGYGYNVDLAYTFVAGQWVIDHWAGSGIGIDGDTF